jgi:putative transposase
LKKSKFSEAQIVKILGEVSSGKSVRDVCSSHGVSEATFYVWKRKYAGMENDDLRRLRELEKENEALKLLLAERDLEVSAVRKLIRKNGWSLPCEPRERSS